MTERKPAGVGFESWVEKQISEAMERGEFDNLPSAGKPFPDLREPYDEMWWINKKLRREQASPLPPTLVLRKKAEDALAAAHRAGTTGEARRIIETINEEILDALRTARSGPPLNLTPFDIDRVLAERRDRQRDRR